MTPTELSTAAGISVPYASQLLTGAPDSKGNPRKPSLEVALRIYDATGLQFGPLVNLSDKEIDDFRRLNAKAQAA